MEVVVDVLDSVEIMFCQWKVMRFCQVGLYCLQIFLVQAVAGGHFHDRSEDFPNTGLRSNPFRPVPGEQTSDEVRTVRCVPVGLVVGIGVAHVRSLRWTGPQVDRMVTAETPGAP